jgi:CRISPR/Cas system CSM-associated protein Csm3 (group 7 of RAMP superfamily)
MGAVAAACPQCGRQSTADNINRVLLEAPAVDPNDTNGTRASDRDEQGRPLPGCYPYIPATSLRGVLRGWCEGMMGAWKPDVASINGDGGINIEELEEDAREAAGNNPDPDRLDEARAQLLLERLDLVSGLFGGARWRSKVEIDPARVPGRRKDASPDEIAKLLTRLPHVAIDPHLGAADAGKLFETELVRPGVEFELTIRARNVQRWELGLLFLALESLNDPVFPTRIGGHTRQGYGQVAFDLIDVQALGHDGTTNVLSAWVEAVLAGRSGRSLQEPQSFVAECHLALQSEWGRVTAQPEG